MGSDQPAIESVFPEVRDYGDGDYARIGTAMPVLMLAMTARTGSAHLCSGLASVMGAGQPFEIFNARITLKLVKERYGFKTFEELMKSAIGRCNECFIFKSVWMDFAYFAEKLSIMFPNLKLVYLDRLDEEAQAVSLARAIVSQEWHDSPKELRRTRIAPEQMVNRIDIGALCRLLRYLKAEKREWESFFFRHDLRPLRLFYEFFREDLQLASGRILEFLNLPAERAERIQSEHRVVSDQVNEIWLKRLRSYRDGDIRAAAS